MSDAAAEPQISPYRRLIHKAFEDAIPLNCQIEITYRCNHLCTFCYNAPSGAREMTTEQIFDALRKVSELGVLYVTLTGGEALCHKDFFKIAAEVRRLEMALRIFSNGYLMADPALVQKIKALCPMEVEISIHGSRPETHDALTRIRGSFVKTVKAVENLVQAQIKTNLKCPITKLNQTELLEIKALADRLGCYLVYDPTITPKDDGSLDPLNLRPDDEYVEKYWGEWYAKLHGGSLPPRGNECESDGSAACGSGRSGFTIDPYGNILPCVALRRRVANILEVNDLRELWYSSPVLGEVRDLSVQARNKMNRHPNGRFMFLCMGTAETQTGDPLTIYPQAEINAQAVRRSYDLLQIGDGAEAAKTA